jgi:hypothetical protein
MSKKNRPAKAPVTKTPQPVVHGDAFRTFLAEATSLGNEVAARRAFDADVGEFLKTRGLTTDFEEWRAKKNG